MTDTLVHVIHKGKAKRPVACVVARKCGDMVKLGWSKCLVKPTVSQRENGITPDNPTKVQAISMAKGRASCNVDGHYTLSLPLTPAINQENSPHIPSLVRKYLRKMADRATRYFKV